MKLYLSPGACSLSPHIALLEGGFSFTTENVDLKTGKYSGGDFTQVNPKGYVPALQLDNGEVLTEGSAIVQYLAEKKPDAKLLPAMGTLERARGLEWLAFISTELHKTFGVLWNPKSPEESKTMAKELLAKRLGYVNQQLQGRDYLLGSQFSVPDAYLFTVMSWAGYLKMDLSAYPNITAFQARMQKRPKVMEALKAEGLT